MDQARVDLLMGRISSALARIEKATERGLPRGGPRTSGDENALRERVGSALAELDAVIESLER